MAKHVASVQDYTRIFKALMVLTATTVAVAYFDLGRLNDVVALTIAVTKATLVVLFFMHLRESPRLTWLVVVGALFWLVVLIGFTMSDVVTRGLLGVAGK